MRIFFAMARVSEESERREVRPRTSRQQKGGLLLSDITVVGVGDVLLPTLLSKYHDIGALDGLQLLVGECPCQHSLGLIHLLHVHLLLKRAEPSELSSELLVRSGESNRNAGIEHLARTLQVVRPGEDPESLSIFLYLCKVLDRDNEGLTVRILRQLGAIFLLVPCREE